MKAKFVPDSEEHEAGEIFVRLSFDGNTEECFWDTETLGFNVISHSDWCFDMKKQKYSVK